MVIQNGLNNIEKMEWKIVESVYYDEYDTEKNRYYHIKIRKRFLGVIPYWSSLTHKEYYDCGSYEVTTTFKSHTDAYDFVHTKLKRTPSGWKYEVVSKGNLVK